MGEQKRKRVEKVEHPAPREFSIDVTIKAGGYIGADVRGLSQTEDDLITVIWATKNMLKMFMEEYATFLDPDWRDRFVEPEKVFAMDMSKPPEPARRKDVQ